MRILYWLNTKPLTFSNTSAKHQSSQNSHRMTSLQWKEKLCPNSHTTNSLWWTNKTFQIDSLLSTKSRRFALILFSPVPTHTENPLHSRNVLVLPAYINLLPLVYWINIASMYTHVKENSTHTSKCTFTNTTVAPIINTTQAKVINTRTRYNTKIFIEWRI